MKKLKVQSKGLKFLFLTCTFALLLFTFNFPSYSVVVYYDDPISVGIGGRPAGMGKAFVALADDPNAMFINPAGLGTQKSWSLSSMSSNFLNEYQYMMFSAVDPMPYGVLGIGYVSSKIGDVAVSNSFGTPEGTTDFYNQAFVLSFGKYIGDMIPFISGEPSIYGGATLKYYSKGFSGDIKESGSGYNVDLGLKYEQEDWLAYGLNFQNVISGSKITGDFAQEDMPFIVKTGILFRWLEHDVNVELDKDMFPGRDSVPWPMHFGVEWGLHPNLTIRAGADQVASSADNQNLVNNTTFGLSIDYDGFKVDLAYVQNYAQTNLASNVVSLSFFSQPVFFANEAAPPVVAPPPIPVIRTIQQKVFLTPATDMATVNFEQYISGVVEPDIKDVWLNGKKLPIKNGIFEASVPLDLGRNEEIIKITDTGSEEAEIKRKIIRFYVPDGVPMEEARSKPFGYQAIYSEIHDYLGKDYAANKPITRDMLALVIAKAKKLDLGFTPPQVFKDIMRDHWAASYIYAVKTAGIINGYSDGTFRPRNTITLTELSQVMTKAAPNMDQGWLLGYLAGRPPKDDAVMADLIEMMYHSGTPGILEKEINDYKAYIGAGDLTPSPSPIK